jgi:parallel beta-helix repeat protein
MSYRFRMYERRLITILLHAFLVLFANHSVPAFADELRFVPIAPADANDPTRTDLQEQLQATFDLAAQIGRNVVLPPGRFYHGSTLVLRGIEVRGSGNSTILEGTTRDNASIVVTGKGARLSDLRLSFQKTTRSQSDTSSLVLVQDATDFAISNLVLDGSDSVGIFVSGSTRGVVRGNKVYNTLADSIHVTGGSSDIAIQNNATYFSGDDGISVVSYEKNGRSSNISIVGNAVLDNKYARGISVVGGHAIQVAENSVHCNAGFAGIYVASESAYATYGAEAITIKQNSVVGCGGSKVGHGAITIFSDYNPNKQVLVTANKISSSPAAGILVLWGPNIDLTLENNAIVGSRDSEIKLYHQSQPIVVSGNTREGGAPALARLIATQSSLVRERSK